MKTNFVFIPENLKFMETKRNFIPIFLKFMVKYSVLITIFFEIPGTKSWKFWILP